MSCFDKTPFPTPIRRSLAIIVVVVLWAVWLVCAFLVPTKAHGGRHGKDTGTAALGTPTPVPFPWAGKHCGCAASETDCTRPCMGCCGGEEATHCIKDPTVKNADGCSHAR